VNNGFYRGLMQPDPAKPDQTVFHRIADILKEQPEGVPLYLTGHSLGGALAVTFAALIAARCA
jgi:thioesterase domain-containing protein